MLNIFKKANISDILETSKAYPLVAIVSTMLLIVMILNTFYFDFNWNLFLHSVSILFYAALGVETAAKSLLKNKGKIFTIAVSFGVFIAIVLLVSNFLIPLHNTFGEDSKFYLYSASLCFIFGLIFIAFNLERGYESLYDALFHFIILSSFVALCSICILVFIVLSDYLFSFSLIGAEIGGKICNSAIYCVIWANFLLFLHNFKEPFGKNKGVNILIWTLNIFASLYIGVLLLYFISQIFIDNGKSRDSIVHLVLWYSFFGVCLLWLNKAIIPIKTIYWRCFLGIIFVLNIIAFYAIAVRLNQYGVTPERYFVFMGCVALAGMVIFSLFFKNPPLKTAILLICIFAFSAFGARFNAINLSLDSQKRQFELAIEEKDYARANDILKFLKKYDESLENPTSELYELNTVYDVNPHNEYLERYSHFHNSQQKAITLDAKYKKFLYIEHYDTSNGGVIKGTDYNYDFRDDTFIIKNGEQDIAKIESFNKTLCELGENYGNGVVDTAEATFIFESAKCMINPILTKHLNNNFSVVVLVK